MPVNRITKPQTINNMPKEKNKKNGIEKTKALITRLEKFRTDSEAGMKNETNSYFSWSIITENVQNIRSSASD